MSDGSRNDYAKKLTSPKWQRKRLEIMERDGWKCVRCGDGESPLHVHHMAYKGDPWECPSEQLITLCDRCHEKGHKSGADYKRKDAKLIEIRRLLNEPWRILPDGAVIPEERIIEAKEDGVEVRTLCSTYSLKIMQDGFGGFVVFVFTPDGGSFTNYNPAESFPLKEACNWAYDKVLSVMREGK